ncbi:MAG: hypothetical protein JO249_15015 [Acidobacteria bacterium]|nr:hypothetical protein [Acidobacteriota bacterium]
MLAKNDTSVMAVLISAGPPLASALRRNCSVSTLYSPMSPEWGAYDVAADGKRFLVDSEDQAPAPQPINLLVNWDLEMKK